MGTALGALGGSFGGGVLASGQGLDPAAGSVPGGLLGAALGYWADDAMGTGPQGMHKRWREKARHTREKNRQAKLLANGGV